MQEPASFREVIGLWSSPEAMALDIGAGVAAARKWSQRDRIPAEWWFPVLRSGRVQNAGITAEMLAKLAAREPAEVRA
jgi:hypothetical protein